MDFFDLITQEELADAPDDPELAFMQLVRHAQRRFAEHVRTIDDHDDWGRYQLEEARHGFMNVVVGLAKPYKIEPFLSMDVPKQANYSLQDYRQFKADLDHYMTQLMVNISLKAKRDSVYIPQNLKDKIRKYVNGIRQTIEKSGLPDARKASLLAKLEEFEAELEKRRLTLLAVTSLALYLAMVPGNLWGTIEAGKAVTKLVGSVFQTVGEAKVAEDEERQHKLPSPSVPLKLLPPRKNDAPANDLDDEIPF